MCGRILTEMMQISFLDVVGSSILRYLAALGAVVAKQLLVHPSAVKQLLEAPWRNGAFVPFRQGKPSPCNRALRLTASYFASRKSISPIQAAQFKAESWIQW